MVKYRKIAFIFPGQGAQYPGMGKEFYESYPIVRETFEEADDILKNNIGKIILHGPEEVLTKTSNSQTGIFVMCTALLRAVRESFPGIKPAFCGGLSLGEYTALHAAESIGYADCLQLVHKRGNYMNDACESTKGTMAVVLGLGGEAVEQIVRDVNMPNDLWAANFNCPGQVVISGTVRGIEAGTRAAKEQGAKRVLPLQVHGAFHSGLMKEAEERLRPYVEQAPIVQGEASLVMNVSGKVCTDVDRMKQNLVNQVTHPVRWEQCVHSLVDAGVDLFVEIGCGKTLSGFNKRIGVLAPTVNIEAPNDLEKLAEMCST